MVPERAFVGSLVAVCSVAFATGCPDAPTYPKCPVATQAFDARRLPALAHEDSSLPTEVGSVVVSGSARVLIQAPKGESQLELSLQVGQWAYCTQRREEPYCEPTIDLTSDLTRPASSQDAVKFGDFEVRCDDDFCYPGRAFWMLTCAKPLCRADVDVSFTLALQGQVREQFVFQADARVNADLCEKPLPVVEVQIKGWDEPPPIDYPDDAGV